MAGNDVFLYVVPSDSDSDDVRLRDPSTVGADGFGLAVTEASDTFAGTLVQGANITLAATEASDTFAAVVASAFVLAATEASDVATLSVQEGFRLAAVEAADTFTAFVAAAFILASTEAADVVSFSVQEGFRLAATEAADVFAGTLAAGAAGFDLASTEAADAFAGTFEEGIAAPTSQFFGMAGPPVQRRKRVEPVEPVVTAPTAAEVRIAELTAQWQAALLKAAKATSASRVAAVADVIMTKAALDAAQTEFTRQSALGQLTRAELAAYQAALDAEEDDDDLMLLLAA